MSVAVDEETFWLGDWRVEPLLNRIVRGEEIVRIDPRNMKVLQLLASRPGHVFSQAEIEQAVWADVIVTPNSVYQSIAQLRRALEDGKRNSRYIETIPRRGYRAVAEVKRSGSEPSATDNSNQAAVPSPHSRTTSRRIALRSSYALILLALAGGLLVSSAILRPDVVHRDTRSTTSDMGDGRVPIEVAVDELFATNARTTAAPRLLLDLGYTALNQGRWKKAREYFEQVLEIERKRVGNNHPSVADLLSELANVSIWGYDYEAAEGYARAAVAALEGMPESYEPRITAIRQLGLILMESGRYDESEPYLLHALELSRKAYGDTISNTTGIVLADLAVLRYSQGKLIEAEGLTRESFALLRQISGEEINQSRASLILSATLIAQSRFLEAKEEAERNLALLHGLFAEDHPYIIAVKDMLAKSLIGLKEYAIAEDVLRRNVELWRQKEGMTQRMAASLSALGEALLGQKRIAQAEECLRVASAEIDGTSMAREEQQWFREHQGRLKKLQITQAEMYGDVHLAEANDSD